MITHDDQLKLFEVIGKNLTKDIECYAFGGTAMMFYGYKDETKDIDLLFTDVSARKEFITAVEKLGFRETSPLTIYIPAKMKDPHRPLMFKNEDTRFDLFSKRIFKTVMSPAMKEDLFAVHEFRAKYNLTINVFRSEHIVLLKAVTDRDKDFEDMLTILNKNKDFNWKYFIDEVIWQFKNGNEWIILDVEKMMKELKKYLFVDSQHMKRLYEAQSKS